MPGNQTAKALISGFFCLLAWAQLPAQEERTANDLLGDGPLDLSEFPAQVVEGVVVPVPSEIFGALEKLGESEWASVVTQRPVFSDKSRRRTALALGISVADGLLAVQAQDVKAVESAGRDVLSLAGNLGLRQAVAGHCQSIFEAANARAWNTVRLELDKTQQTVRDTMEKMRDEPLADLVSMGGWVRGTEAITELITNSFTTDKAEVLQQPGLVRFFRASLLKHSAADVDSDDAGLLVEISKRLDEIGVAMKGSESGITSAGTLEIHEAATRLVALVLKKKGN